MSITGAMRDTAHVISLIVDIVIIGALCLYVTYKLRTRDPYPYTWWKMYGPTIIVWISYPLILMDPLRHVLNDDGAWAGCDRTCGELWPDKCIYSSNEYKCAVKCGWDPSYESNYSCDMNTGEIISCTCVHDEQEDMYHLSPVGWLFMVCFTYIGFALFMFGSLWNADIIGKCKDLRHKYRVLRGYSQDSDY